MIRSHPASSSDSSDNSSLGDDLPVSPPDRQEVVIRQQVRRLSWRLVGDATLGIFSLEAPFARTLRDFMRRPRMAFESYLGAERFQFSNPLKLFITLTAVSTFLSYLVGNFEMLVEGFAIGAREAGPDQALSVEQEQALAQFIQRNYNLMVLGGLPVVSLITRLVYRKRVYNFPEHLALNSFAFSVITALYLVQLVPAVLLPMLPGVYMAASLAYLVWAYRRILGPGWIRAISAVALVTVTYAAIFTAAIGLFAAHLRSLG